MRKATCAIFVPGAIPPNIDTEVDVNELHSSFGLVLEKRLHDTRRQRGVTIMVERWECEGCSMAKGRAKPFT